MRRIRHNITSRTFANVMKPPMMAIAISQILLAIGAGYSTEISAAPVQASSAVRQYAIAGGPLEQAIVRFGQETGIMISYTASMIAGKQSAGVQGEFTTEQAITRLFSGSGVQAVRQDNGGYILRLVPVVASRDTLPVIHVAAGREVGTEGTGSYATGQVSMGKGQSLRDIPQSVTVVTRQQIEDQALNSIGDVMTQAAGVTVVSGDNGEVNKIYARGFSIDNVQIDGVAMDGFQQKYFNPNLAMYDSVEVVRGADGLFSGTGEPGGSINLVRKRPLAHQQVGVVASVGSWNHYRAEIDATGPLNEAGTLRARGVLTYDTRDYFYHAADAQNKFAYGIVDMDLTPRTRVAVGASYEKKNSRPWQSGLPRSPDGTDLKLPRETALMASWNNLNAEHKEVFAQLEYGINDRWRIKADAQYIKRKSYEESSDGYGAINPATGLGNLMDTYAYDFDNEIKALDVNVNGDFDLFGRRHSLLIGGDWREIKHTNAYHDVIFGAPYDDVPIGQFDPSGVPYPNRFWLNMQWPDFGSKQTGVYGRLKLSMTERLTLLLGGRYANYDNFSPSRHYDETGALVSSGYSEYKENGIFTPYVGLMYAINDQWTVYGSASSIHKSQANRLIGPLPGKQADAVTGRNIEVGAKGEHFGGRLTTALALYRIERKGEVVRDPQYPSTNIGELGINCCWMTKDKAVSQGIEAEVTGQLRPGWQVAAGYTYNNNKDDSTRLAYHSVTPKHLFKLWSTYRLPQQLSAWTIGGGVNVQSDHHVDGTVKAYNPASGKYDGASVPFAFKQAGYAVWNASIQYRASKNWTATLNINNLLDKTYYKTVGKSDRGNWYGDPRNVSLTLRGMF